MGIGQDFAQARLDLKRVGGIQTSKDRLRNIVEGVGQDVRRARDCGTLAPAWTAPEAKLDDGTSLVYTGIDGVMAPTVTQGEKDKRRKKHVQRRKQREQSGVGNAKRVKRGRERVGA